MSSPAALTPEMMVILGLLSLTLLFFIIDIIRVDVVAMCSLLLLGLLSTLPGLEALIDRRHLFDGFSSNAVIAIIAMMIIGAGLDRTGIMHKVAKLLLHHGRNLEKRLLTLICLSVGSISSCMQNAAVTALFLPVVNRIHLRSQIPMRRLLIPMGFCTICGGTITMIGSSPLILLNDLIAHANHNLSQSTQIAEFGLLSVMPIGLALLASALGYFLLFGRWVLPRPDPNLKRTAPRKAHDYFANFYGINGQFFEARVNAGSPLLGLTIEAIESRFHIPFILALKTAKEVIITPTHEQVIHWGDVLGILAEPEHMQALAQELGLELRSRLNNLAAALDQDHSGIAEIVIPPSSQLVGKMMRDIRMRKTYGFCVIRILRGGKTIDSDLREQTLIAGDTLVVHTHWNDLHELSEDRNFVIISDHLPGDMRRDKAWIALAFFLGSLGLSLLTTLPLSLALFAGAMGMVLCKVLRVDEAYAAVDWKNVCLLASLIPLGLAAQTTGTASWLAQQLIFSLGEVPHWVLQTAIAVLATLLNLVISNIGATVLLVPLAINVALSSGADPALFALTVAICASNAFLLPTNQVSTLIIGPGGYRTKDFLLAGSGMSLIYLLVSLLMLNWVF